MQAKVELIGPMVDKQGVYVDENKVEEIKEAVTPNSRNELGSFLGLASYYQQFVFGFTKITKPLTENTYRKVKYLWTSSMQEAFAVLKEKITTAHVLSYHDY